MNDDERQARLAAIRERLEAATPGPWQTWPDGTEESVESASVGRFVCHMNSNMRQFREDASLIANAPADLAWLLAEVERLEAERLEAERNGARKLGALTARKYTEQLEANVTLEAERDAERHHRINLDVIVRNLTDKTGQLERALETAARSVDDWREAWEQKQVELVNVEAERDAATARAERAGVRERVLLDGLQALRDYSVSNWWLVDETLRRAGGEKKRTPVRGSACCHCDQTGKEKDGSPCWDCKGTGCYTHERTHADNCLTCAEVKAGRAGGRAAGGAGRISGGE